MSKCFITVIANKLSQLLILSWYCLNVLKMKKGAYTLYYDLIKTRAQTTLEKFELLPDSLLGASPELMCM